MEIYRQTSIDEGSSRASNQGRKILGDAQHKKHVERSDSGRNDNTRFLVISRGRLKI